MAKPVDSRGNLESKSCSFYADQMDFIEHQCEEIGLNFPQYIRKLVDDKKADDKNWASYVRAYDKEGWL